MLVRWRQEEQQPAEGHHGGVGEAAEGEEAEKRSRSSGEGSSSSPGCPTESEPHRVLRVIARACRFPFAATTGYNFGTTTSTAESFFRRKFRIRSRIIWSGVRIRTARRRVVRAGFREDGSALSVAVPQYKQGRRWVTFSFEGERCEARSGACQHARDANPSQQSRSNRRRTRRERLSTTPRSTLWKPAFRRDRSSRYFGMPSAQREKVLRSKR